MFSPGSAMLPAALPSPPRCLPASPLRCHAPTQQPAISRGLLLRGAGSPVVKRLPAGDWLLWYHSGARIALSTSPDGLRWSPPVAPDPLLPSTDWWVFDTAVIRPADVLVISGSDTSPRRLPSSAVYWLYYTGSNDERFASPFPAADVVALPGLAISQDGRHWARIEGDHHTGALIGVGDDYPQGWEKRCASAPKVVMHADGDLRMYYHSFDEMSQRHAIGVARSRDGIRWKRVGKVLEGGGPGSFNEGGVRQGHVVRDRAAARYIMVYEGLDRNGRASIGMAVSEDGLKGWRGCSELPVLRPSEKDAEWDAAGVGSPCLVQMDGPYDWRLYYMGVGKDGEAAIGMAYSEGHGLPRFEKCDALLMYRGMTKISAYWMTGSQSGTDRARLKVKGSIESEDKDLSFLNVPYRNGSRSCVNNRAHTSKLCTLELTSRHVFRFVEATISVKVLGGSWPDGFQGIFAANTTSIDDKEVLLLAFGAGKLPVSPNGMIKLSRALLQLKSRGS